MGRPLRLLLVVNLLAKLAAGVVLLRWLAAIPASVGIALPDGARLVAWLFGAAELALASMTGLALRARSEEAVRPAVATPIVLHVASGLAVLLALPDTNGPGAALNLVARLTLAALLGWFGLRRR